MSRPSAADAEQLAGLESLGGLVADIQQALGILSIRIRQIKRRAQGDRQLMAVVDPAGADLARIADDADDMHGLLCKLLAELQAARTEANQGDRMRPEQVVQALRPVSGMLLRRIEDPDRQETMDQTLEVIKGWELAEIGTGRVESPDHPQRVTDVHLRFTDGGQMPEFALSVRATEVYRIQHRPQTENGVAYIRTEILFRRGHTVAVELV
jgi:hypothetical protein